MKVLLLNIALLFFVLFNICVPPDKHTTPDSQMRGKWVFEINSADVGFFEVPMTFEGKERKDSTAIYSAYSRKNALRKVFGLFNALKFRLFSDYFEKGTLLRLENIQVQPDSTISGKFVSAFASYDLKGAKNDDTLFFELFNNDNEIRGKGIARKVDTFKRPGNLDSIASNAIDTVEANIFNPGILQQEGWQDFKNQIQQKSKAIKEDIELLFAFFYYKRGVNISHLGLFRENPVKKLKLPGNKEKEINLSSYSDDIGIVEINSFAGNATLIKKRILQAQKFDTLFVDLRNNSGGDIEGGLTFASMFVNSTMTGGYFLTRKWFDNHDSLPQKGGQLFPTIDTANFQLLMKGIHEKEGLSLKVHPSKEIYKGKVYIVTSKQTASTCEPIVYAFKQNEIATIVGSQTAGAMLNAEYFDLQNNYQVVLPTAEYYANDGFRLEGNGVAPDIKLDANLTIDEIIAFSVNKQK